ncbi:hypothetical protein QE152_g4637 [Popillia japonica]|uniref:Uncharacterized protein n=1 Tax=Popillia japonica TaxID=7064 RepID=A0AAW1MYD1_POPJA
MNQPSIESGLQLFARTNESQNNQILKFPILPGSLYAREFIEISGECGVGKSLLLLDFIVNAILPQTYGHVANLLELKLKVHLKMNPPISIIHECLKKITMLNCYDSIQLKYTFLNLDYYWMDRADLGCISFNNYCSTVKNGLLNIVNDFNLIIVYTKTKVAHSGTIKNVDYTILLKKLDNNYEAVVSKQEQVISRIKYALTPFITFCI